MRFNLKTPIFLGTSHHCLQGFRLEFIEFELINLNEIIAPLAN